MGLPIWREPEEAKHTELKPKSDLTPHHGQARSAIRRHPSVRISNNARNPYSGASRSQHPRRGASRSPPPEPAIRDIPPVPELSTRRQRYREAQHEDRRARRTAAYNEARLTQPWLPPLPSGSPSLHFDMSDMPSPSVPSSGAPSYFPTDDPLPDQYRPRRRDARSAALAELPPLRRMGYRSINEGLPSISQLAGERDHIGDHGMATGLGDRQRSWSPEADQWETLLTTITPDPSIPSAESSFDGVNPAQTNHTADAVSTPERQAPRRPISALRNVLRRRSSYPYPPRSPPATDDAQPDDNCPPPPIVPSQPAQLSFGEIARDVEATQPRPSTPPPSNPDRTMPRSISDSDRLPTIQQLLEAQGSSRDHHQRTHDYFTDFIRAFIRGDRTEAEAQLTIRAFDRLAHYMTAERMYHSTRMPEQAQDHDHDHDDALRNLRDSEAHDHDEIDRWLLDHITEFDTEQRELQEALDEVCEMRELAQRRPLDREEIVRRNRAERFLGEAAGESRRARNERVRRERRGRGVQERL